jgi:hypothetical protein
MQDRIARDAAHHEKGEAVACGKVLSMPAASNCMAALQCHASADSVTRELVCFPHASRPVFIDAVALRLHNLRQQPVR